MQLFVVAQISAQSCTPLSEWTDSTILVPQPYQDIVPGSGIKDTACVGTQFATVFHIKSPNTITVSGVTLPVTNISIATTGAFSNLPASLSYTCNPPNCVFLSDSIGCIYLAGTPQPGEEGEHDLVIEAIINSVVPISLGLPGPAFPGNYFLHVRPADHPACLPPSAVGSPLNTALSVSISPNPFRGFTSIGIQSPVAGDFRWVLTDMMGRPVQDEWVHLLAGENNIIFSAESLTAGCYFFMLGNERHRSFGRMVVIAE